jgi:hypothetical protein
MPSAALASKVMVTNFIVQEKCLKRLIAKLAKAMERIKPSKRCSATFEK